MSFYNFAVGFVRIILKCLFRIRVEGVENIPRENGFLICPNHKSLFDPLVVATNLPIQFNFMAKEELFKFKPFGALLKAVGAFPVKRGAGDIGALKTAIKVIKNGGRLVLFPEGTRSSKDYMNKGKSGAVLIAIKSEANILPVGIQGSYRLFGKLVLKIGEPIVLDEYFGRKNNSETLQAITDTRLMPAISELSGVCTYENRDC